MKKVVHLAYEHAAKDVRIFLKECRTLAAAGYEVTYITSSKHDAPGVETVDNVRIIKLGVIAKRGIGRVRRYLSDIYIEAMKQDSDIYQIHEYVLIPVAKKLIRQGKKVIYDTHENYAIQLSSHLPLPHWLRTIAKGLIAGYERHFIQKCSGLICAVPNEYERLKEYNKNNLLLNNYPLLIASNVVKEDYVSRPKCACYTGIISHDRGAECMIESLGKVKHRLLLAGPVSDDYLNVLRGVESWNNVKYFGTLSRNDMEQEVWNHSIAGIVMFAPTESYMESVPNKLYEYMSAGLPVIASDFPMWRGFFAQHQCGILVEPMNPEALSDAFETLSNDPEYAYHLGQNGISAINNKLNWNSEAKRLLSFYEAQGLR